MSACFPSRCLQSPSPATLPLPLLQFPSERTQCPRPYGRVTSLVPPSLDAWPWQGRHRKKVGSLSSGYPPPPSSCLKGTAGPAVAGTMEPRTLPLLLPLLLVVLVWPLAVQPAPPTCYSRMLTLSREIMADFQSLQASEPEVSSSLASFVLGRQID